MNSSTLIILSLIIFTAPISSQNSWKKLTTDDGLYSNKVLTIYQAKNGDIWIGTQGGLQLYNGIFKQNNFAPGSFDSILEIPTGQIIARRTIQNTATSSVNLELIDGLESNNPEFLSESDIILSRMDQFSVLSDSKIWFSTLSGLISFDGQSWQLYDPKNMTDWLVQTPDGRFWTRSWRPNTLASFDGKKWNQEFDLDGSVLDELNAYVQVVFVTSTGKILLGTDTGLFQYDTGSKTLSDLRLGKVDVRCIHETAEQTLWIGTNQGIFRVIDGKWKQILRDQSVTHIHQTDREKIFVSTNRGLYRLDQGKWITELNVFVHCFIELEDGTFLVGCDDGLRIRPAVDKQISIKTQLML